MKILEMPEVTDKLEELRDNYESRKNNIKFIEKCLPIVDGSDLWYYSKKQYFHPLPYENEISGFKKGVLLKKSYPTPFYAAKKGNYCFGFIDNFHRITLAPTDELTGAVEISHFSYAEEKIFMEHSIHFNDNSKMPQLRGLSEFFKVGEEIKVNVAVGSRGAFYVYLYHYNSAGQVDFVKAFSKNWLQETEYNLHYRNNDEMYRITIGDIVFWESS
jgi:hypothetical protein